MDRSSSPAIVLADVDSAAMFRARLDRVEAGDMDALGELFVEYGDLVYRSAYRLTGHSADAEDAAQEVFVRLPAALRGFTGGTSNFAPWLRRIAVRQALMLLRGTRRRRELNADEVLQLLGASDGTVERLTIDAALLRLTVEHRTVFLLKEVEGYDHAEIAALLGISVANSEVRLHRARRHLRDLLRGSR